MRVTTAHWTLFLDEAENNPQLITNRFNGAQGKTEGNMLWQNLCNRLNALGYGEKSVNEWRKAVTDWKSKTKCKAAKARMEQNKTGGGPSNHVPLTLLEERLVALMGKKAIDGENVPELGVGSCSTSATVANARCTEEEVGHELAEVNHDHTYEILRHSTASQRAKRLDKRQGRERRSLQCSGDILELTEKTYCMVAKIESHLEGIAASLKDLVVILKDKNQ